MTSFKYLIFITLAVYSVAAEEGVREKKHAYYAAAPAPVLGYSALAPGSFSYGFSDYAGYPYNYPVAGVPAYHAAAAYPVTAYAAPGYPSYHEDDGQYWPGKYEKTYAPAVATAYEAVHPSYPEDDGQYSPDKYEKPYAPAVATAYEAGHSSYPEDDGQYSPDKYEKPYTHY